MILRITSDVALYTKIVQNKLLPIVITVMGMRAKAFLIDGDADGSGIIRLHRIDEECESIGELKLVTDWITSDNKIWDGFVNYKTIEMCKGVID